MDKNSPVVNGIYNHINNGGISLCVTNEQGPTINIQASHFGHLTNHLQIYVTADGLRKLGNMFLEAAEYNEYSPDYVCAAETLYLDKESGKVIPNIARTEAPSIIMLN
jgi:hypothetical protein